LSVVAVRAVVELKRPARDEDFRPCRAWRSSRRRPMFTSLENTKIELWMFSPASRN
jgi:hypothetical protein